jgi:hypothetical protein
LAFLRIFSEVSRPLGSFCESPRIDRTVAHFPSLPTGKTSNGKSSYRQCTRNNGENFCPLDKLALVYDIVTMLVGLLIGTATFVHLFNAILIEQRRQFLIIIVGLLLATRPRGILLPPDRPSQQQRTSPGRCPD